MNSIVIFRLAQRYASRRLLQSVFFVLGVALGVAVVIAIDLANNSASRAFNLSTESVTGNTTHQILGGPGGLPTEIYRQVRVDLGLRDSAPVVEGYVRSTDPTEPPLRVLGVDPFAEAPFRSYLTDATVDGGEGDAGAALNAFIARPGTVLISETLANRQGIGVGDRLVLRPGVEQAEVEVVGVLRPSDDVSQQALDDLLLADISTAQLLVGEQGRLSRIDLILPTDADFAAIEAILPEGARLVTADEGNETLAQMTAAFELNLQALSLLALVVGAFLIYNTVTFSVVQRRPVIGTLRSLGATREQIFVLILSEAILLSVIGTAIGLGLGVILGRGAVGLVSQTISDLYFTVSVNTVTVQPATLVKGAIIGISASTIAALVPSWDATRTAPAGVLRRSSIEDQTVQLVPYITGTAAILNVIGLILLLIPSNSIALSFSALFCIVVGSALFTPAFLLIVMRAATPLTSRVFGLLGRMAPRAVSRSLSRTSVAVAALTVAVSVIVGVSVMISSFRNTVSDWLQTTLSADIYISPVLLTSNRATLGMDPDIRDQVAAVDGVERVSAARGTSVTAPDYPDLPPANITAVEFDLAEDARRFRWTNLPDDDHEAALEAGQVMVSEPFAFRRGITPQNNTIDLLTDEGVRTFEIFGVFYDYSTDQGTIFMSLDVYRSYWDDDSISSVAAYVEPGQSIDTLINQLQSETLAGLDLNIQSNRALRESVFAVFDQAFQITIALRLLATVVAFIGILSALLSLQLENTRQYGLMRAIGLTPGQLGRFTLIQTGLMGFVAGLLALPIGLALAAVLIYVINIRSFGWTMGFVLQADEMSQAFAVAVTAALIAGLYPAWRLGKIATSQALRAE